MASINLELEHEQKNLIGEIKEQADILSRYTYVFYLSLPLYKNPHPSIISIIKRNPLIDDSRHCSNGMRNEPQYSILNEIHAVNREFSVDSFSPKSYHLYP